MLTTSFPPDSLVPECRAMATVRLTVRELELIELSLKALGYAPGHDYGQVQAARALADYLRASLHVDGGEPIAAR